MRWIMLLLPIFVLYPSPVKAEPTVDQDSATARLLQAVDKNDPQAVIEALQAGAQINSPKGSTALFEAVEWKQGNSKNLRRQAL